MAGSDDTVFVFDEQSPGGRRTPHVAIWVALTVFAALVVILVNALSHSPGRDNATRPSVVNVPGRAVGDDKSLAEAYAGNRVLRDLQSRGVATHGAGLTSSCTSTSPHDVAGVLAWDCSVRADAGTGGTARFVVHVRKSAGGAYSGRLDSSG